MSRSTSSGACRAAGWTVRSGCGRAVGIRRRPPEGRLVRRARRLAEARSVGEALRLHLGRWHPSSSTPRRRKAVHPGADRRDAGRPQGTGRLHRWRPRERAGLARSAAQLKRRGLDVPPRLAIADGALGLGQAQRQLTISTDVTINEVVQLSRAPSCWTGIPSIGWCGGAR